MAVIEIHTIDIATCPTCGDLIARGSDPTGNKIHVRCVCGEVVDLLSGRNWQKLTIAALVGSRSVWR